MSELRTSDRRLVLALLGTAGICVVLHLALVTLGGDGRGDMTLVNWVGNVGLGAAAAACLARAALVRAERAGWLALGTGLALWFVGDVYWTLAFTGERRVPYPNVADALYLTNYVLDYVGIVLIVRARTSSFEPSRWLDGVIGGLAAAAMAAAFVAPALTDAFHGDPAAVATNLAYPLGDALLISFVVGALAVGMADRGIRAQREWALLAAGLLIAAVADALYLRLAATTGYLDGSPIDSMWVLSAMLTALAAWAYTRPAPAEPSGANWSLLFTCLFATVALGVLALEVVMDALDPRGDIPTVALGLATATLAAVVGRLYLALKENTGLLEAVRFEAGTDDLTGLANRRQLVDRLERLLDPAGGRPTTTFALFDLDGFKVYNDTFGHFAGDLLLRRLGRNLRDAVAPGGTAYRLGGDEFCVLIPHDRSTPRAVLAKASSALVERGEGFVVRSSFGSVALPDEAGDAAAALRLADRRMYAHKGRRIEAADRQTRAVLMRLLREREPALGRHVTGVGRLALDLGQALGLGAEDVDILTRAAELHDVGKVAIPDEVLHKRGELDETEWRLIRSHTLIGERVLSAAGAMAPVARIVRSSHERWDGNGYPDGLAGEDIPLAARIVFVCDAFDAMCAERPYGRAMNIDDALEELRDNAGTQFDPALVELFCDRVGADVAEAHPG